MKCKVCGEELGIGCKPMNWQICQTHYYELLNVGDWKNIHQFNKIVYLPFLHLILSNAEEREARARIT